MWGQRKKLESLYEELKAIAMLDRLYDDGTHLNGSDNVASIPRQRRQSEILAEIAKLETKKLGMLTG